jgi:hypothetical protein
MVDVACYGAIKEIKKWPLLSLGVRFCSMVQVAHRGDAIIVVLTARPRAVPL